MPLPGKGKLLWVRLFWNRRFVAPYGLALRSDSAVSGFKDSTGKFSIASGKPDPAVFMDIRADYPGVKSMGLASGLRNHRRVG